MSRKVWIMGAGVIVVCCAADMVMHCENWAVMGATLLGGMALGYGALQKAQEPSAPESDSHENSGNSGNNENSEEMSIEHGMVLLVDNSDDENENKVVKALMTGSSPLTYNFRSPSREMVVNSGAAPLSSRSPGSGRRPQ